MPASAQPRWTECQLSLPPHSAYYYIQTRHGKGEMGISESVAAAAGTLGLCKLLCCLPLIASRNTPFLPSSAPPPHRATNRLTATVHPHRCHIASTVAYLGSLAYCTTLGDTFDLDHWSRSAVDDVTIIDHFVKWSRQALLLQQYYPHYWPPQNFASFSRKKDNNSDLIISHIWCCDLHIVLKLLLHVLVLLLHVLTFICTQQCRQAQREQRQKLIK